MWFVYYVWRECNDHYDHARLATKPHIFSRSYIR
jgi:hypothetical protein